MGDSAPDKPHIHLANRCQAKKKSEPPTERQMVSGQVAWVSHGNASRPRQSTFPRSLPADIRHIQEPGETSAIRGPFRSSPGFAPRQSGSPTKCQAHRGNPRFYLTVSARLESTMAGATAQKTLSAYECSGGARGGTRTPTPLLASGPKPGASTNFATRALKKRGEASRPPQLRSSLPDLNPPAPAPFAPDTTRRTSPARPAASAPWPRSGRP